MKGGEPAAIVAAAYTTVPMLVSRIVSAVGFATYGVQGS